MPTKLNIKTYESFSSPVVEFKKRVYDDNGKALCISPGKENSTERGYNSFSIDIHEFENDQDVKFPIRDLTQNIVIELLPDWVNQKVFEKMLPNVLNNGEKPLDTLALSIRLVCPKINYVIETQRLLINDITKNTPIKFRPFNLNDVIGKVEVQSEIIRIKSANPSTSTIAFSSLTVLSRNRIIVFYVDEAEEIGRNALPLIPGDTKDKMFFMKNGRKLAAEPPTLVYHKQFKDFFNNGDDYKTVQSIMLLIGLPYCEQLLKWIIFGKPDYEKKEHKVIIKFIAELCDKRETELKELSEEADEGKKISEYLTLSHLLFDNIQSMGIGWKKMLYQIVQTEKN